MKAMLGGAWKNCDAGWMLGDLRKKWLQPLYDMCYTIWKTSGTNLDLPWSFTILSRIHCQHNGLHFRQE